MIIVPAAESGILGFEQFGFLEVLGVAVAEGDVLAVSVAPECGEADAGAAGPGKGLGVVARIDVEQGHSAVGRFVLTIVETGQHEAGDPDQVGISDGDHVRGLAHTGGGDGGDAGDGGTAEAFDDLLGIATAEPEFARVPLGSVGVVAVASEWGGVVVSVDRGTLIGGAGEERVGPSGSDVRFEF